jgi:hypothetical protein
MEGDSPIGQGKKWNMEDSLEMSHVNGERFSMPCVPAQSVRASRDKTNNGDTSSKINGKKK